MTRPVSRDMRRTMFLFMCWLYMALGIACLCGGIYLEIAASRVTAGSALRSLNGIRALSAVLIFFGLWRSGLAVYHIRRVTRARSRG